MTVEEMAREIVSLRQRVDLAETRLSQVEGRFEFISGQLRDMQLYQHAKFSQIEGRLDKIEGRMDRVEIRLDTMSIELRELTAEVRALPRAIAELIAKR